MATSESATTTHLTTTQQTQQQRREILLAVARSIVIEKGGEALSMKSLAEQAGVPRATLYRYYASKEQLIGEMALQWGKSFVDRLQSRRSNARTVGQHFMRVIRSILKEAQDHPNLISATLMSLVSDDRVSISMQGEFEQLLPALLGDRIDMRKIPNSPQVLDSLLRLLLSNLLFLGARRVNLKDALANMEFAAQCLIGKRYWQRVLTS